MDNHEAASTESIGGDREDLARLANWRMPFGKYKGTVLVDLPEPYVVWFINEGVPRGKLGELLRTLYVIKANGLEHLLDPFRDGSMREKGRTNDGYPRSD